jgi:hypothetical protein
MMMRRVRKVAPERLHEFEVLVGERHLHAGHAPVDEIAEDGAPGLQALCRSCPEREVLPVAGIINADHPQRGSRADAALAAQLLVMRIDDEVRVALAGQDAPTLRRHLLVQILRDRTHGRGRDQGTAELLDDLRDLPGRDAVHMHLDQRLSLRP